MEHIAIDTQQQDNEMDHFIRVEMNCLKEFNDRRK